MNDGMGHGMGGMGHGLPPLGWHAFFGSWQLAPGWLAVAAVLLASYVAGLVACRRRGVRAVHPVRVGCFVAAVVVLVVTVSSSIGVYAMSATWVHMVEHLLLIMVVPALLVLGGPLSVLRAVAASRGREQRVDALLQRGPVALLTHPLVALVLYAVVIVGTHLTSFMDTMATRPWLMPAEQALYVVSGYLVLLPLVGAEPIRWRLPELARVGLLLLAMTPDTVVGIVLMQANHDLSPVMSSMHPSWAPDPMVDQEMAGALMWAGGDGLMMFLGVGVTIAIISRPTSTNLLGQRLESIRRAQLSAAVTRGDDAATPFDDSANVDDDDAVLDAYNRMLRRMQ